MAPLGAHEMARDSYAARTCGSMIALVLDFVLVVLTDSFHYTGGPGGLPLRTFAIILDIGHLAIASLVRLGFEAYFLSVVFQTAHFKLGRHSDLWNDFGATLKTQFACFFLMVITRCYRCVRGFRGQTEGEEEYRFWTSSVDAWIYTCVVVVNIVMTMVLYVRSIDALRRLSRPIYYLHPAQTMRLTNTYCAYR
mmetsp:Transcript_29761/g.87037  ORF Transcript_29761/g.87037 Transcript_29761/m.87037 type:complete len:194 (+) Transcript_29761:914-1495(+)